MEWLRGDHRWIGLVALVVLIVALAWLLWQAWRRPKATPYGNYVTAEMDWLWQQMLALEPSSKLGGVYASKPGYHNIRNNLPAWDYSVCDRPPDDGGPGDKAAAIDWTFPNAQGGDYSTIAKYTKRLIDSGKDVNDPRLNGWREVYGNADNDTYVEGWDFRYGVAATSDSSHLWHIHLSENRDQTTSKANKEALLSVLKGESVDDWLGPDAIMGGDGAVLLNCPYDTNRLDLFLVGPTKSVLHRWWSGGMDTAWSGSGVKTEDLGGAVEVGTLTAAWAPDGDSVNIAGLGKGDSKAPAGCGMYWGMNLQQGGGRSGWGSFEGAYGKLPAAAGAEADVETQAKDFRWLGAVALAALLVSLFALVFAAGWLT